MKKVIAAIVSAMALLSLPDAGRADFVFIADITNNQENPPAIPTLSTGGARPASFGSARFVLNDAMTEFRYTATVFNIDFGRVNPDGSIRPQAQWQPQTPDLFDDLTATHIHAAAPPGRNAGVVFGFIGAPFNDINPRDVVVTPFATGVGGTVSGKWDLLEGNGGTTLTAQLPNLFGGLAYINFHTVQFGGGEARGQIFTPEPGGITLFAIGMAILGIKPLRRRLKPAAK
jgi:hypothetical protein